MTKTKKIVSTFLAVIMLLSMFSIVPMTAFAGTDEVFQSGNPGDYETPSNMLYVSSTSSGSLKQRIEVVPGATYYYAFGLSNNSTDFTLIGQDKDRNSIELNQSEVAKIDAGSYTLYKYAVTIPEDIPIQSRKYRVFIGLSFATEAEIYAFDFSLVKTDDDSKTNVLSNGIFETNLNDWAWGDSVWFITGQNGGKGQTEWQDSNVTIEILPFDSSLFGGAALEDQMLYFNGKNAGPLMERRTLVPGTTYNISFNLTNNIASVDLACKTDDDRKNISIEKSLVSKEDKGTYSLYNYTFTYPATAPDDFAFIGFTFPSNSEGYIFDTKLWAADDINQEQKITNGDFKSGLDHWAWDWDAWFESWGTGLGKTEWSNDNVALNVMAFDESKFALLIPKDQMLYFSSSNAGPLMTRRTLVPGASYNLSFGLSNNVDTVDIICKTDGDRSNIGIEKSLVSKENKGTYSIYNYTFTYPTTGPDDLAFIGFTFTADCEGYIFNVKMTQVGDETEKQLISNGDFQSGLNRWAWDWDAWFESWSNGLGKTEWTNGSVTLNVVEFDESKFSLLLPTDKMLYFSSSNSGPLMVRRTLIPGASYNISFGLSNNVTAVDVICKTDSDRKNVSIEKELVSKEDKGTYSIYNYTFTYPESGPEDFAFVGFTFPANCEGYIFNIKMTRAGDETEKPVIPNGDFQSGLDHWAWDWDAWFETWANGLDKTEWNNDNVALAVMDFDESKFTSLAPEPVKDQMLYFNSKNVGPLMVRKTLIPGASYNISFGLSNNISTVDVVCRTNDDRKNISIEKSLVSKEDKGTYSTYNYTFTYPQSGPDDFAFVGFTFAADCEGYIFDIKMTQVGDETEKQLISNGDFQSGLNHWTWDWDAWFESWANGLDKTEWNNDNVTLSVMDFDESKFSLLLPKDKMLYFNSKNAGPLMVRKTLIPGAAYNLSFGLSNSISTIDVICKSDGDRNNISIEKSLISKEDKGTYSIYNYTFTYPQSGPDDFAFVGFTFAADCEGYIFDIKMTQVGDETEKQLISNGDFQSGLNHWAWDWDAWFESWANGLDKTEWNNDNVTLSVMDFDESKFVVEAVYTPGDINNDGKVNNKDLTRLFQFLSDWDVEVNEAALDINGDGRINNKDLTRLFQYLSDWNVEIF